MVESGFEPEVLGSFVSSFVSDVVSKCGVAYGTGVSCSALPPLFLSLM